MIGKEKSYRIGELAEALGLSHRTVRYYEEVGLIRPTRSTGGFRLFSDRDLERIRLVLRFKGLGLSLEEIRKLLCRGDDAFSPQDLRAMHEALASRRQAFAAQIDRYREGIAQIDRALEFLEYCDRCGDRLDEHACHACVKNRGDGIAPLIDPGR